MKLVNPFETIYKGYKIEIKVDETPTNPRKEMNCFTTIVGWHSRYTIGDGDISMAADVIRKSRHYKDSWENEEKRGLKLNLNIPEHVYDAMRRCKDIVSAPLYMIDHGGISISTKPFLEKYDSGQIGIVYVEHEKIKHEYNAKKVSIHITEKVHDLIEKEVEVYNNYLNGECYGITVSDPDGKEVEAVWGYYGLEFTQQIVEEETKRMIDKLTA